MKRLTLLIALFALLLSVLSYGQSMTPIWTSFYQGADHGDNSDKFNKVVSDKAGNYVAVGYTYRPGNYRDFLTVKFNGNGDTLWWRTKNGNNSGDDEAIGVAVNNSGDVYVTGYTDNGNRSNDIMLIKYNSSGTKVWDTLWNGASFLDDIPVAIALDASGNIFVGGYTVPDTFSVANSEDYITLKFDSSGALLWQSQYSRAGVLHGRDEEAAMAVDANGDVYVTGRSYNGGDDDIITMKYNGTTGAVAWTQTFNGGNGTDRGAAITIDPVGNVIIAGRNDNGSNDDFRTIKYSNTGSLQWSKSYNGPANQNDRALVVITDTAGSVYVSGQSDVDNSSVTDYDFATVKYTSAGAVAWSRTDGGPAQGYDIPSAIAIDPSGNVIITGKSDQDPDPIVTDNDFMTVMYTNGGVRQWVKTFHGTLPGGLDTPFGIVADATGIYVAGTAEYLITHKDATVVKYNSVGDTIWVKHYNGEGDLSDVAKSIAVDGNDNTYVAGYSFQAGHNRDICLVDLYPNGDTICTFLYNGLKTDDDELSQVAVGANGFVYATGYTKTSGEKSDFFTMKWDPANCVPVWIQTYDGFRQSDKAVSLGVDAAGSVYVTGKSDSNLSDTITMNDIVTIKYNTNGNQIWLQRYNGPANLNDEPVKLILDHSGNVLVTGISANIHDDDVITLKYDAGTGSPSWTLPAIFNGFSSNDDRPLDITVDAENDIFVSGYIQTASGGAFDDVLVLKYDSAGSPTAGPYFFDGTGSGNDDAVAITCDYQDNILVAIKTDVDPNPTVSNYNYLTMKFDNTLVPLWASPPMYNSPVNGDDVPVAIATDANGQVIVAGSSVNDTANGRSNTNWVTIRYDGQGNQLAIGNFDGPNATDDIPYAVAIRGTSLWVTGYSEGTGNNLKDITTLRYDLTVGVNEIAESNLAFVFPNPMTETASIQIVAKLSTTCLLRIFDSMGRVVVEKNKINSNKIEIERGQLLPGIYHYEILAGDNKLAYGKFIVQNK